MLIFNILTWGLLLIYAIMFVVLVMCGADYVSKYLKDRRDKLKGEPDDRK